MQGKHFLAIDLGAESGRGVVGSLHGGHLTLTEVHRFPNAPIQKDGHLHWDVDGLFENILEAVRRASANVSLSGIGIDTWGVDFGLLGADGALLEKPFHYRDSLSAGFMEEAIAKVGAHTIFSETGIQFLPFNTIYQLLALQRHRPELLERADALLMMGELFTYWLTGQKVAEWTNATTSQLVNPRTGAWSDTLLEAFDLPGHILQPIVQPATVIGPLLPEVAAKTGADSLTVSLPAVHDTGSAVAAVPAVGDDWCYLISGTWSLLGVEAAKPVITSVSERYNFTNEGGIGHTFRLLKNVMGLWILQECRRQWTREGTEYSYAELTRLAQEEPAFRTFIDPDDRRFLSPGDMPQKIADYARETGQPVPENIGQFVRCVLESLALKYRYVIEQLEEITGKAIRVVHIVGGGSQNAFLNQATADATGRQVIVGPVEATATGNILAQAMSHGQLSDIQEGRALVRASTPLDTYEPKQEAAWTEAFERFTTGLVK